MSQQTSRDAIIDQLCNAGIPADVARIGIDLAFHACGVAADALVRTCEAGTGPEQVIALQFAPQLMAMKMQAAMALFVTQVEENHPDVAAGRMSVKIHG